MFDVTDEPCEAKGCTGMAVVGLNQTWLCLKHFREGLREVRKVADRAIGLLADAPLNSQEPSDE